MRKLILRVMLAFFTTAVTSATLLANVEDSICFQSFAVQNRFAFQVLGKVNNLDSLTAFNTFNDYISLADKKGDLQLKYEFEIVKFIYLERRNQIHNGGAYLLKLLEGAEKGKLNFLVAEILQTLGQYQSNTEKNYTSSLEYLLRAYDKYKDFSITDFPQKADYIFTLGGRYYQFRDFYTAKRYFLETEPLLSLGSPLIESKVSKLNTVGLCYRNLDQLDSAELYLVKSRDLALKTNDLIWVGIVGGNLGSLYAMMEEYDKAIPLLERDVDLSIKANEWGSASRAMGSLAYIFLQKNNKNKAWEWSQRSLSLIYKYNLWQDLHTRKVAYQQLAKVYLAYGSAKKAYQLMDSSAEASDLVEKERTLQYIAGVQYKLDAEQHFAELKLKESEIGKEKQFRNSLLVGLAGVLIFAGILFMQKRRISKQRHISDNLLKNILPAETAEELKRTGAAKAKNYDSVTVLFTDFKNFTELSTLLSAEQLVQEINYYYSQFDQIVSKYNLEKIKTIGDSYMCAGGLPVATKTHAIDVIDAAVDMVAFMEREKVQRQRSGKIYLEMRIGINTGSVVAGIVGIKKFTYDIWGDTVNIASRMESAGVEGKINISETTYELIKNKYQCTYRGKIESKNNQMLKMYFVETSLKPMSAEVTHTSGLAGSILA